MGIPPMAGFFAKLMVLASTINLGYISLALLAVIGSIISSVNYLNLIKIINMNLPDEYYTFTVSKEISYYISIIVTFTTLFLFYPLNLLSLSN